MDGCEVGQFVELDVVSLTLLNKTSPTIIRYSAGCNKVIRQVSSNDCCEIYLLKNLLWCIYTNRNE